MRRMITQAILRRCLLALFAVLMLAAAPHPAFAADKPSSSSEDLERLVSTIEDAHDREKLVKQLKAMIAVQKKQAAPEGDENGLLGLLSQRIEDFSEQLVETALVVSDAPKLLSWIEGQVASDTARSRWTEVLSKFLAILAGGIIADFCAELLLRRPRRALEARGGTTLLTRLPLTLAHTLLSLMPLAAFVAAAYGMLPVLQLKGDARVAALMVITAYGLAKAVMILAQAALMPRASTMRMIRIDDETANYLSIWVRRLTNTGIYGYFALEAARLLGLPKSGYTFTLKVLGLVITTMLVIFILQNRQSVAAWLRLRGGRTQLGRRLQGLRNRFADIWHVLATLYIIAIYAIWALNVKGGFEYVLKATVLTAVILHATVFISNLAKKMVDRAFTINPDLRSQFPHLEGRANRYLPVLHHVLRVTIGFITVLALLQAWGVDTFAWLTSDVGRRLLSSLFSIAAVLVGALLVWEIASSAIERYLSQTDAEGRTVERSARARTLLPLLRNLLMVVLLVFTALIVLSELGINIAPLLAGAGVVGLAIGFGSQKLVQDLITGAFILFEDTVAVGDVVKVGEHAGAVEAISIRSIRLRDAAGAVHTIPFSAVSTVVNMTKDFSFAVFDIGVDYTEDTDRVVEALRELGAELQADAEFGAFILAPVEILGVDRFLDSSVVIKARIKTQPSKQWQISREFNRRMKKCFDERGISIPFPHTTFTFKDHPAEAKLLAHLPAPKGNGRADPVDQPTPHQAGLRSRKDEEDEDEMEEAR